MAAGALLLTAAVVGAVAGLLIGCVGVGGIILVPILINLSPGLGGAVDAHRAIGA